MKPLNLDVFSHLMEAVRKAITLGVQDQFERGPVLSGDEILFGLNVRWFRDYQKDFLKRAYTLGRSVQKDIGEFL